LALAAKETANISVLTTIALLEILLLLLLLQLLLLLLQKAKIVKVHCMNEMY
jgi:hypothetical protein